MKFADIEGNLEIKRRLIQTVKDQRVSHAQLFFGPEGNDKLALAIAYAQFINCTNKQGIHPASNIQPDSCGTCPSCIKYQKLIHPDLHFIFPVATTKRVPKKPQSKHFLEDWRRYLLEKNYRVSLQGWYETIEIENKQGIINADDCNEIITTLGYKSYESDYKVMIIWMVERLYYSAAPKILKILEEPSEKTLFLLIADDPDQIIKTILSRTLMVRIPLPSGQLLIRSEETIQHFELFRRWMRACYGRNILELTVMASELSKPGREKQKDFLNYGLKIIGFCASLNYRNHLPEEFKGEELKFIRGFSPYISHEVLTGFNELFNAAIFHVERNIHGPTLFLDLSLKIVRLFNPKFVPLS